MNSKKTYVLVAIFVAAAGSSFAADEAAPWPADAAAFEGHHYHVVDEVEGLSWQGARDACAEAGGHLAVISNRPEAEFVAGLADGRYLFLGASDAGEEGTWTWVDGTPWDFTFWYAGQPNDYGGTEDFLATYDDGRWVDVDASGTDFWMPTGYLCEWDR